MTNEKEPQNILQLQATLHSSDLLLQRQAINLFQTCRNSRGYGKVKEIIARMNKTISRLEELEVLIGTEMPLGEPFNHPSNFEAELAITEDSGNAQVMEPTG